MYVRMTVGRGVLRGCCAGGVRLGVTLFGALVPPHESTYPPLLPALAGERTDGVLLLLSGNRILLL